MVAQLLRSGFSARMIVFAREFSWRDRFFKPLLAPIKQMCQRVGYLMKFEFSFPYSTVLGFPIFHQQM